MKNSVAKKKKKSKSSRRLSRYTPQAQGISAFVFPRIHVAQRKPDAWQARRGAADIGRIFFFFYGQRAYPASALLGRRGEGFKYAMGDLRNPHPSRNWRIVSASHARAPTMLKYSKQRMLSVPASPISNYPLRNPVMMADMANRGSKGEPPAHI